MVRFDPKNYNKRQAHWQMSERALAIVKHFSTYSDYSEESIVGTLIVEELLSDEKFIEWAFSLKNNKRILKEMGIEDYVKPKATPQ